MRFHILAALTVAFTAIPAIANEQNPTPTLHGAICGSVNAFTGKQTSYECEIIGHVKNIDEIYQKGYRVVSSGFVPQSAAGPVSTYFYLVIEERN